MRAITGSRRPRPNENIRVHTVQFGLKHAFVGFLDNGKGIVKLLQRCLQLIAIGAVLWRGAWGSEAKRK